MSLFNPWVLLGIVLAVLGAGTSGYFKGSADEFDRQQLEIAALNAKAKHPNALRISSLILILANASCSFLSKPPTAPYQPPQMPPLPPEIAFKQEPNLTERLLKLLSPSQMTETKQSDN